MDTLKKIEKHIRKKEKQVEQMRKKKESITKSEDKDIKEDNKLKNIINPFYKRKWNPRRDTISYAVATMLEVKIGTEIKELKKLLKPTASPKS